MSTVVINTGIAIVDMGCPRLIRANSLVDGTGTVQERAALLSRAGRIKAVGRRANSPISGGVAVLDTDGTLLPGFCHLHGHGCLPSVAASPRPASPHKTAIVHGAGARMNWTD